MNVRLALFLLALLVMFSGAPEAQIGPEKSESPTAAERYATRRARLMTSLEPGSLLVLGQVKSKFLPRNKDLTYLTGIDGETAVLLLFRSPRSHGEILFLPSSNSNKARWEGGHLSPGKHASKRTGIDETLDLKMLEPGLAAISEHVKQVYFWGDHLDKKKLGPLVDRFLSTRKQKAQSAARAIARLRLVKDEHEIALLQRAIDITAAGILEAMASARPGMFEFELEAIVEYFAQRHGAPRMGFDSIVGSGPNSCILHYDSSVRKTTPGDLVVMDVGAEFGGYSADVTRTFPISGKFTPRQREIYEAVLKAQDAGIARCVVGATTRQVHSAARAVLEKKGLARYFYHGTSHWLGLDVHDVGSYRTPLKPGMVLTVEPGVYIDAENLGVRIEDDILVTANGPVILSRRVPRKPDEIEAWMKREGIGNIRRRFEPEIRERK